MAERRMFSKRVVNSGTFLRMPPTSRLLYYDLGMAADDDGVVEAFTVLRTTGAAEDDLRVLAAKGYIQILNEDFVSYIRDWSENNQIRKDRYKPSIYAPLLVKIADGNQMATIGLPSGSQTATQTRQGKDKSGEERDSLSTPTAFCPPTEAEVKAFCLAESLCVDPKKFVRYYAKNGWCSGGEAIRDWKALARSWSEKEKSPRRSQKADHTPADQSVNPFTDWEE